MYAGYVCGGEGGMNLLTLQAMNTHTHTHTHTHAHTHGCGWKGKKEGIVIRGEEGAYVEILVLDSY